MKHYNHKIVGTVAVAFLSWSTINAQGLSPAGLELLKQQNLWFASNNAAGMVYDESVNFSNLTFDYGIKNGNYARPAEGSKERALNIGSEGFLNLKNMLVWGAFSFEHENKTDAGYNASITDPYRGMPYYVVDKNLSDWRNQYYNLQFKAATPQWLGKWTFGLQGKYLASIAAKQLDMRVDTRFYTLELMPGVTFAPNNHHVLGLNLLYRSVKEDSRMDLLNRDFIQEYYELYGLGVARPDISTGKTTNYNGDEAGLGLQYQYRAGRVRFLADVSYSQKVEDVDISYSNPQRDAAVNDKTAKATLSLFARGDNFSHAAKLSLLNRWVDGIQYLNQRDNSLDQSGWIELFHSIRSTYHTQAAGLDYSLLRNRGNEYNWKLDGQVVYSKQKDEYILPYSIKDSENLYFALTGKKNINLSDKLAKRLLLTATLGYNTNLSGSYVYGGSNPESITVTVIEQTDEQYLTSDYYKMGASVAYSQRYREDTPVHWFLKADLNYIKTSSYDFSKRSFVSFSAGLNF